MLHKPKEIGIKSAVAQGISDHYLAVAATSIHSFGELNGPVFSLYLLFIYYLFTYLGTLMGFVLRVHQYFYIQIL